MLADTFIFSNFNHCPLIWYFSTAKQLVKIEKIQERVLRFVNNDYNSDYLVRLNRSGQVTMDVKCMRYLCIEIYKSLNGLNPSSVIDIFSRNMSSYSSRRSHDLSVLRVNQTSFGLKKCKV